LSRCPHPNTPHWQRLVATFREIAGRSWRATAAEWGGVERQDLRACVDRELTVDKMTQVDQFLIGSLEHHIRELEKSRAKAADMILEIHHAGYERGSGSEIETQIISDGTIDAAPVLAWWYRTFAPELDRTAA
jgi:hypothetical protein